MCVIIDLYRYLNILKSVVVWETLPYLTLCSLFSPLVIP